MIYIIYIITIRDFKLFYIIIYIYIRKKKRKFKKKFFQNFIIWCFPYIYYKERI